MQKKNKYVNRWLDGPYPAGYQIGDTSVIAGLTNIRSIDFPDQKAENGFTGVE